MSNTKAVRIVADVPFCWLNDLPDRDGAAIARLFLNPVSGLKLEFQDNRHNKTPYRSIYQQPVGYEPNEHGGKTAMYRMVISGTEAFHIESLVNRLREVGTVHEAHYIDLDDDGRKYELNYTGGFSLV